MKCRAQICGCCRFRKFHLKSKPSTMEIKAKERFVLKWIMFMASITWNHGVHLCACFSHTEVKSVAWGDYDDLQRCLPSLTHWPPLFTAEACTCSCKGLCVFVCCMHAHTRTHTHTQQQWMYCLHGDITWPLAKPWDLRQETQRSTNRAINGWEMDL